MPEVSLSGIDFTIKGSSDAASESIDTLIEKLNKLTDAISSAVGKSGISGLGEKAKKAVEPLDSALQDVIRNADKLQQLQGRLGVLREALEDAFKGGNEAKAWSIQGQILSTEAQIERLTAATQESTEEQSSAWEEVRDRIAQTAAAISGKLFSALKSVGKVALTPFRDAAKSVTSFTKSITGLLRGFKRIAMYRAIRAIIREITQAFSEGVKHLYAWSKAMRDAASGDLGRFADSMDSIATSMAYFKNSIGAAVAPLINALAPAIDTVTNSIIALLNAINQLLARLGGQSSWTRAVRHAEEYEDALDGAGGSAKELMRYLAPFDELNRLPSNRGGGGGGGADDVGGLFEEMVEFEEGISDFADRIREAVQNADWEGLGKILGDKVNEIIDKIDFAGIGAKLGEKINALFTTRYWTLETINFQNIGAKIAEFFNNTIKNINFETIGASIIQKFTILGDLIIGAVENINWTEVGASIGGFVRGAFNQASGWLEGLNFYDLGYGLVTKLSNLMAGVDFKSVWESVKRFLKEALKDVGNLFDGVFDGLEDALGIDITFGIADLLFEDKTGWDTVDWIDSIAKAIGPVAGAILGGLLGGGPGAMFGGFIGIALSLTIQSISNLEDESGWTIAKWQGAITSALIAVGGAAVGLYFAPGLKGALLGASIGIALALVIKNMSGIENEDGWARNIWEEKLAYIFAPIAGAAIGWKFAQGGGLVMGLLLGIGVSIVMSSMSDQIKNNAGEWGAEDWARNIIAAILPAAGYIAGLVLAPASGGALIGAVVGVSLAFAITHLDPDFKRQISEMREGDDNFGIDPIEIPVEVVADPNIDDFQAEFQRRLMEAWGLNPPKVSVEVELELPANFDEMGIAERFYEIKRQLEEQGYDKYSITLPVGLDFDSTFPDLAGQFEKFGEENGQAFYFPIGLIPDDEWKATANGGDPTVQSWVKHRAGRTNFHDVGLQRSGWTTVAGYVGEYAGGLVSKAVTLTKSNWTYISEWLKAPARSGGVVNKPVGVAKNGWTNLADWVKKSPQYGGIVSKTITLATVMSTIAATLTAMAFVAVWNSLTDKTLTLTVKLDKSAIDAWNTVVSKWNNNTPGKIYGSLPYLSYSYAGASKSASMSYSSLGGSDEKSEEDALYKAMLRALNDSDFGDIDVNLDGDPIYKSVVRRNKANTRMTGVNQLA